MKDEEKITEHKIISKSIYSSSFIRIFEIGQALVLNSIRKHDNCACIIYIYKFFDTILLDVASFCTIHSEIVKQ